MDFAMPFMIQTMREMSNRIEKLEEAEKISSNEEEQTQPIVYGIINIFNIIIIFIVLHI